MHTPPPASLEANQASPTVPTPAVDPSAPTTSNLRATLRRLGLGKRRGMTPHTASLEAEVEDYLGISTSLDHPDIIQYWQVCASVSYVEH